MLTELTTEQIQTIGFADLISGVKTGMLTVTMNVETIFDQRENMPDEFMPLRGVPIHIGAASRKYNIPNPTITRWVQKGYITELGKVGQKKMIDEGEMAWRAAVYKKAGGGQGKKVFVK